MIKTDYIQFKKELTKTGKTYFSVYDLKKFYPYSRKSLKVLLSHWTGKELIFKLGKGFYAFDLTNLDYLRLSGDLNKDSYVSFEYALYFHGLINQVPSIITAATKKRSKIIRVANWTFEYTRLKEDLFFGYELKNGAYIAAPEKALADLIYLAARGKRITELDTLEKKKLNRKKLRNILKKFPGYTMKKAGEIGLI